MLSRVGMQLNFPVRMVRLLSLALAAALIFLLNWRPSVDVPLDLSRFGHDSGFAYIGPVPTFGRGAYVFQGDTSEHRERSELILLENGRPLDPHRPHDIVRQKGGGGYSHSSDENSEYILFSASDNTDPLTNGRRYTASGMPSLLPVWQSSATAAILAILLANLFIRSKSTNRIPEEAPVESLKSTLDYRPDIDGLRAVAVSLVILFHLGVGWMPGGYVGVDVFFVISGYLITSIISWQIETNRFSFVEFYQRRIKRIFPALFAVVAATMPAGVFLLLPGDYVTTAKSAVYAVTASSNFYFLFNTGYFDAAAEVMPLLHTWSLGVEEQFYLVWPALLVGLAFAFRSNKRRIVITLSSLAFLSYVCGIVLVTIDPKAAFYLPFTRVWEFVAGALVSRAAIGRFQVRDIVANASGAVGLVLIVGSALVITNATPFPGWMAMLPVIGAVLVVAPFNAHCAARYLLRSPPFVFTGRISYSLYLWHWPIITLYRHYNLGRPISSVEASCLAVVIVAVSFLSWRYVEEPFRRARWPAWTSIGIGFATASALAAAALVVVSFSGFPQRMPASARLYESLQVMWQWQCPQQKDIPQFGHRRQVCVLGANWETAKTRGILIGDSHAEHFMPLLDVAAREADVALIRADESCMPLIGATSVKRYFPQLPNYTRICTEEHEPILAYIRAHNEIQLIVLAAAWSGYPNELYRQDGDARSREIGINLMRDGIKEFAAKFSNRQFLIISDVPRRQPFEVGCLARSEFLLRSVCPDAMFLTKIKSSPDLQEQVSTDEMMRGLVGKIANVTVSVPHDYLCGPDGCPTLVNNEFLYRDGAHLRRNLTAETKRQLSHLLHLRESLEEAAKKSQPQQN